MFARVYTAPPQEVFFDMYENDASFDEAAKNLYNQELEQGYDTASLDEFLEPGIEDFDETAVEKAIYQTAIAQEQGGNPVDVITTPYGSGLLQDEYDEVLNMYPGIGAGVEWRTMDDHYHDAEDVFNDPRAGMAISNLVDTAVGKAEDEGAIDSLGDIFKAFGEQLGRAGQGEAEAHVASRTGLDDDTGDLFLGPSVGPNPPMSFLNKVGNTASEMNLNVDQNVQAEEPDEATYGPQNMPLGEESVWLLQDQSGDTAGQGYIREFIERGFSYADAKMLAENKAEMGGWKDRGVGRITDWIGKMAGALGTGNGSEEDAVAATYIEVFDEILTGVKETEPDKVIAEILTDIYNLSLLPESDAEMFGGMVQNWAQDKGWAGKLSFLLNETGIKKLENRIKTDLGEGGAGVAGWAAIETETKDPATTEGLAKAIGIADIQAKTGVSEEVATQEWEKMSPEDKQTFAEYAELGAPTEQDMRTRHNRSLSRAFYETLYAQPWGGKEEFRSILPTMHSETKTLFFIAHALPGVDGLKDRYKQDAPKEGDLDAEYKAGDDYKKFLRGYLQNPDVHRKGTWIADRIKRINELLQLKISDPRELTSKQMTGGTWTKDDQDDWLWIQPLFAGETQEAKTNRYNLIAMVASRGQQGYMANIIKAGAMRAIQHYENMGLGDSEIFTMMTRVFGETGGKSSRPPRTTFEDPYAGTDPYAGDERIFPGEAGYPEEEDIFGPAAKPIGPGVITEGVDGDGAGSPIVVDDDDVLAREFDKAAGVTDPDAEVNAILAGDAPVGPALTPDQAAVAAELDASAGVTPSTGLSETTKQMSPEDIATVAETMATQPAEPVVPLGDIARVRSRQAPVSVMPTLSDEDIADMLAGFDMGGELRRPPPRRMQPSLNELDQMMIDFGM